MKHFQDQHSLSKMSADVEGWGLKPLRLKDSDDMEQPLSKANLLLKGKAEALTMLRGAKRSSLAATAITLSKRMDKCLAGLGAERRTGESLRKAWIRVPRNKHPPQPSRPHSRAFNSKARTSSEHRSEHLTAQGVWFQIRNRNRWNAFPPFHIPLNMPISSEDPLPPRRKMYGGGIKRAQGSFVLGDSLEVLDII